MEKFDCPVKFIAMGRQLHNIMLARVQINCQFSDPFPVTKRFKQGCLLAANYSA